MVLVETLLSAVRVLHSEGTGKADDLGDPIPKYNRRPPRM
jgi:hypothetical protein